MYVQHIKVIANQNKCFPFIDNYTFVYKEHECAMGKSLCGVNV